MKKLIDTCGKKESHISLWDTGWFYGVELVKKLQLNIYLKYRK